MDIAIISFVNHVHCTVRSLKLSQLTIKLTRIFNTKNTCIIISKVQITCDKNDKGDKSFFIKNSCLINNVVLRVDLIYPQTKINLFIFAACYGPHYVLCCYVLII